MQDGRDRAASPLADLHRCVDALRAQRRDDVPHEVPHVRACAGEREEALDDEDDARYRGDQEEVHEHPALGVLLSDPAVLEVVEPAETLALDHVIDLARDGDRISLGRAERIGFGLDRPLLDRDGRTFLLGEDRPRDGEHQDGGDQDCRKGASLEHTTHSLQ